MPATKAKSAQKRTLRPKKTCRQCSRYAEQVLDLSGENERLEHDHAQLDNTFDDLFAESENQLAMLDVMAKALESAEWLFAAACHVIDGDTVELARKESAIRAYQNAWGKGQPGPAITG